MSYFELPTINLEAIAWILLGLVVCYIMVAMITKDLTAKRRHEARHREMMDRRYHRTSIHYPSQEKGMCICGRPLGIDSMCEIARSMVGDNHPALRSAPKGQGSKKLGNI